MSSRDQKISVDCNRPKIRQNQMPLSPQMESCTARRKSIAADRKSSLLFRPRPDYNLIFLLPPRPHGEKPPNCDLLVLPSQDDELIVQQSIALYGPLSFPHRVGIIHLSGYRTLDCQGLEPEHCREASFNVAGAFDRG